MVSLFVYGTLCFPEIIQKLTGKPFVSERAVLKGYQRRQVKDADFPAIITSSHSEVRGLLLKGLDERSFDVISFYEGDEYRCDDLEVQTENKAVKTRIFVWNSTVEALEDFDWDIDEFAKNLLEIYIEKIIPQTLKEYNFRLND